MLNLGIRQGDHVLDENQEQDLLRDGGYQTNLPADIGATETFGQVYWIKMRSSNVDNVPTFCSEDEKASPKRSRDCKSFSSVSWLYKMFAVSVSDQPETPSEENVEAG